MKYILSIPVLILLTSFSQGFEQTDAAPPLTHRNGYAVVVSKQTFADTEWKPVVNALVKKHGATLIQYGEKIDEILPELTEMFPRYACFVAKPEEANRKFVANVHVLTRKLDDDPYPDLVWGIITGYEPEDALRIAEYNKPLLVKRCLTATVGAPLAQYDEGIMFNELKANVMWVKSADGIEERTCPTDTIKLIVDNLNSYKPDAFITSGHATERNWMPGFSYRNGIFRCKDGRLYGYDTKKIPHEVKSTNPKVYLPVGNCLIAHIPDKQCMALALMRSAGVYQMVGYTIPTGYGYGGWGVKDYFSELQAGRFTLAQANFANQIAMIYNLEKLNMNTEDGSGHGLRGDRDTVVLYGDPAWEARMKPRELPWSQELTEKNGEYTFTITCNRTGDWDNRPIVHFLEERLTDIRVTEGAEYNAVIADDFILVKQNSGLQPIKGNRGENIPIKGEFKKGEKITIKFKGTIWVGPR